MRADGGFPIGRCFRAGCVTFPRMKVEEIRRIAPDDWLLLKEVRLAALADSPDAFSATLAEAEAYDNNVWRTRAESGSVGPHQATFLLAADQQPALGMITGLTSRDSPNTCQLVSTWVAPSVRGRGYGKALTSTLIRWATESGFTRIQLWVTTTNHSAIRLYESTGFAPAGVIKALPSNSQLQEALYNQQLRNSPGRHQAHKCR